MTTIDTANGYANETSVNMQWWKLPLWFTFNPYVNRMRLGEGGLVVFNLIHSIYAHRSVKLVIIEFILSFFVLSALYAFNDYNDRNYDINNTKKDRVFIASIIKHHKLFIGINIFWTVLSVLLYFLFMGQVKAIAVVAVFVINYLYSTRLKSIPVIDIISVMLWGGLFVMLAGKESLLLFCIGGVMTGIAHTFQIITDKKADIASNIKTSVVAIRNGGIVSLTICCIALGGLLFSALNIWWGLSCVLPLAIYAIGKNVTVAWYISRMYFFVCWLQLLNFYYGGF